MGVRGGNIATIKDAANEAFDLRAEGAIFQISRMQREPNAAERGRFFQEASCEQRIPSAGNETPPHRAYAVAKRGRALELRWGALIIFSGPGDNAAPECRVRKTGCGECWEKRGLNEPARRNKARGSPSAVCEELLALRKTLRSRVYGELPKLRLAIGVEPRPEKILPPVAFFPAIVIVAVQNNFIAHRLPSGESGARGGVGIEPRAVMKLRNRKNAALGDAPRTQKISLHLHLPATARVKVVQ